MIDDERWCIWMKWLEDEAWMRTNVVAPTIDSAWYLFNRSQRHSLEGDYYAALVVPLNENPNDWRSA
jgi:hypothetical protein